jgi:hypothetical protein
MGITGDSICAAHLVFNIVVPEPVNAYDTGNQERHRWAAQIGEL